MSMSSGPDKVDKQVQHVGTLAQDPATYVLPLGLRYDTDPLMCLMAETLRLQLCGASLQLKRTLRPSRPDVDRTRGVHIGFKARSRFFNMSAFAYVLAQKAATSGVWDLELGRPASACRFRLELRPGEGGEFSEDSCEQHVNWEVWGGGSASTYRRAGGDDDGCCLHAPASE